MSGVLDIVGERWTLLILRDLFVGMARFEDIRRDLGIASNVLTVRLKSLEGHGIVERRQYQTAPVRHEYRLTAKGADLYPVILTLLAWGDKWLCGPPGPAELSVHNKCGLPTTAKVVCAHCGAELTAADTEIYAKPWPVPMANSARLARDDGVSVRNTKGQG
jgi:DNA-binding HxlR family transcriptional regulator